MGEFAIGQGVPRFEDPRLIRGGGRYIDDVALPGTAYAVMPRSPPAHARLRALHAAEAKGAARARPGRAYAVRPRAPHAHARIRALDAAKAKAAPGVLAILTGADWAASGFADLPVPGGLKRRDGSPMYRPRFPALATDRVRYVGDPIAFVGAGTQRQAMDG